MTSETKTPHILHPRLPVWVINLVITIVIFLLLPLDRLADRNMDPYYLRIAVLIALNIILATSLNLVNGITGQFSLGHAGFMAVGAYVAGSAMKLLQARGMQAGMGQELAFLGLLIAGGLAAALFGLLVGIPTLRLRGDYLAIATLGFGEIINILITNTEHIGPFDVGGSSGLKGIPLTTNLFWAYAWMIVTVVTVWRLAYSAKGLAFRAVREDEVASAAMGVDVTFYKVAAFVIGAFFAGVAGGLYACYNGIVDPESIRFTKSIEFVVMVVLGGTGSVTGVILAAAVLTWMPEQFRFLADWRMIVYSLTLILVMLLRPTGLLGSRELWPGFMRRRRQVGFDLSVQPKP